MHICETSHSHTNHFEKTHLSVPNTFGENILFQSLHYKLCLAHLFSPPNALHEKKNLSYIKDILLANWNFFFYIRKTVQARMLSCIVFTCKRGLRLLQESFPGRPQKWVQGFCACLSGTTGLPCLGPSEPNCSMSSFQSRLNFRFFTTLHTKRWANESYLTWNKYFRIENVM